jgi:hypothetical protein
MSSAPVLALPDFSKGFVLETDASHNGVGVVLMQNDHPIAFLSKALGARNQALSVYEKECLAILLAIDKWRSYLQHGEFIIRTDHKSLLHLTDQRLHTSLQHKAFVKLMGLQFKIQYKKGNSNLAADALSRKFNDCAAVSYSMAQPSWLDRLQAGYEDDAQARLLIEELGVSGANDKGFSLRDGVLRFHGRIWVGNNTMAQDHILQALHSSGIGGHSGVQGTYHRVKQYFSWPHMKKTVQDYVAGCQVCQQAKPEHVKLPGLLQPLPIPVGAWKVICMDFIEGLPLSHNHNVILVVIDKFICPLCAIASPLHCSHCGA